MNKHVSDPLNHFIFLVELEAHHLIISKLISISFFGEYSKVMSIRTV